MKMNHMKYGNMKKVSGIIGLIIIAIIIVGVFPATATIFTTDGKEINETGLDSLMEKPSPINESSQVLFFYDPECGACQPVHDYLESYLKENPDTILDSIDLADGNDKMDRFNEMKLTYNREKIYIPVVFFGPVALEGTDDIMTYFDEVYAWYMKKN